jgi:hypothetical protein
MEKIPPQVPSLELDNEVVFGLTVNYITKLVREVHRNTLHRLDDNEIHDLVVDALLRNTQLCEQWDEPATIIQNQFGLASYVSSVLPLLAQREQERKTAHKLREIPGGLIPIQMYDMVSEDTIPGCEEDLLHEETLALFGNDTDWHQ